MRWLMWLPVALLAGMYFYFSPSLPDPMASHFDLAGRPDDAQSKAMFFAFGFGAQLLMLAIFGGIEPLMRRLPPSVINVPNRDYWLAPERREATIARFGRGMAAFGLVVLCFLDAVFYLVIRANLDRQPLSTTGLVALLAVLGVATLALVIWMFRAFRRPEGA